MFRGWVALLLVASLVALALPLRADDPKPQPGVQAPVAPGLRGGVFLAAQREADRSLDDAAMFRTEREAMQWLRHAQSLLAERRYAEATRFLGRILESPQDYFYQPDKQQQVYRSLKSEAQRLVGQMPRDGRQSYELQYGAMAARRLEEAVLSGDRAAVADVARRFFHTAAGYEATYLLASDYLRNDRPMAAALCFERLRSVAEAAARFEPALSVQLAVCWLRSGIERQAEDVLIELRAARPNAIIRAAGEDVPIFSADEQALGWLERIAGGPIEAPPGVSARWSIAGGSPSRNYIGEGGVPLLEMQWRVPTTIDPAIAKWLDEIESNYRDLEAISIPAVSPLVVDDTVLMRTTENLLAVDFQTGKRLWEVPVGWGDTAGGRRGGDSSDDDQAVGSIIGLGNRMWRDATYGELSSDGRLVFAIESDEAVIPTSQTQQTVFLANGARQRNKNAPSDFNRLAAFDVETGKLMWELGGPRSAAPLAQAGTFFLGAPLPLDGRLYVLGDDAGEIRLLVVDAQTGRLEWSQQLAFVERTPHQDLYRRRAGISPSYADGALVCPTAAGAAVAVDLTTRSLLWGYRYSISPTHSVLLAGGAGGVMFRQRRSPESLDYWIDATAILEDGKALLTPAESDSIHCLDLRDGSLLWQRPRNDSLYVAGVVDENVYLVGRKSLRALSLADGADAWSSGSRPLPEDAMPSGRGFLTDGQYFLPLTSAQVATIDLASGEVVSVAQSRKGEVPGNLVYHDGSVLAQSADRLDCYYQLAALREEVDRRLADDPTDARALAMRAEIRLHEGQLSAALEDLRQAYAAQPDPRTRQLLVESLIEAVQSDFARYAEAADELASLVERPEEQAAYLRIVAEGLASAGRPMQAFDRYMRLAAFDGSAASLESIDASLSVRRDRWLQARLGDLRRAATDDQRQEIDDRIAAQLEQALASSAIEDLRAFVRIFATHPLADEARWQLASRLAQRDNLLEAELLLRQLEESASPERRPAATARLAQLLREAGRVVEASIYYQRLAGELANVVCLDGKTGEQLYAELAADEAIRRRAEQPQHWPSGDVEKEITQRTTAVYRYFDCEVESRDEPFFDGLSVEFDQGRSTLIGRDDLGRVRWRVALFDSSQRRRMAINAGVLHGAAAGHLLVVSAGHDLFAIDTLGMGQEPRVLWKVEARPPLPGLPVNRAVHAGQIALAWGDRRTFISDAYGQRAGSLGPVTSEFVCFQQDRDIEAVDPVTGETLWVRHGLAPGCDLWGDDERLFVAPPGETEAIVLRPHDGAIIGRREVPPENLRMAKIGGRLLVWSVGRAGQTASEAGVELVDPWEQRVVWRKTIDPKSKAQVVDDRAVAIIEPQGRFLLLDLDTGHELIDEAVDPEPQLHEVHVLPSTDVYIVVANRPWRNNRKNVYVNPVPGGRNNPLVDGRVYGFDRRTGKRLWDIEINRQGLMLDQPAALPVLVFAARVYEKDPMAGPRGTTYYPVTIIDKRTGDVLHDERVGKHISGFDMVGDMELSQVTIKHIQSTIEFTFREEPAESDETNSTKDDETASDSEAETEPAEQKPPAPDDQPPPAEEPAADPSSEGDTALMRFPSQVGPAGGVPRILVRGPDLAIPDADELARATAPGRWPSSSKPRGCHSLLHFHRTTDQPKSFPPC